MTEKQKDLEEVDFSPDINLSYKIHFLVAVYGASKTIDSRDKLRHFSFVKSARRT